MLRYVLVAMFALSCCPSAAARDMAVVVQKGATLKSVSMPDLVKICKGITSQWPEGHRLTFVTRDPTSPEMKLVLQKVYGMTSAEVNAMIAAVNRRSDHAVILVVASDDAVVKRVESTPGAIGLVDIYSINNKINVIRIDGKLPLEPGYVLHGN